MAQAKDLNISPYYNDFDPSNDFYRVLFKPGFPVQARELTNLQSILQNQIQSFGSHTFKEGAPVDAGEVTFDIEYYAVKVNSTQFGIDISLYTDELIGKTIEGESSGVTASVDKVVLPDGGEVEDVTLYVKYSKSSPNDFSIMEFIDGEILLIKENIIYGNTTINADTAVATLISSDAKATGSAAFVAKGIYFIRGTFVEVSQQDIILDHYTNKPSYKIGFQIDEEIISAKDDELLYDNAQGFTNYAAPGADRLKITLTLTKKLLDDEVSDDFFEILRLKDGKVKRLESDETTIYSTIGKEFARRTYEESGNYALEPFDVSVSNSLNNGFGNGGLYNSTQQTEEGNTPSDDLMCLEVSEGEAYVRGYEVNKSGLTILDVDKPRDVEKVDLESVDYQMGDRFVINNVYGQPGFRKRINLYNEINTTDGNAPSTAGYGIIGHARIYSLNSKNSSYEGITSEWDLYLWDIQIFTHLTFNIAVTATEFPADAIIRGLDSGATGYIVSSSTSASRNLYQVTGSFIKNEEVSVNGIPSGIMVENVHSYNIRDVLSVWQDKTVSGLTQNFSANIVLNEFPFPNGINEIRINSSILTAGNEFITGIQTGNIVKYQLAVDVPTYNRVTAVAPDGKSLTLGAMSGAVSGVFETTVQAGTHNNVKIMGANLWSSDNNGGLYEVLPKQNISSVDLSNSSIVVSSQITGQSISGAAATVSIDNVTDGSGVAISTAFFEPYNVSNYSIHYGATAQIGYAGTVTSDSFSFKVLNEAGTGGSQVQFTGLTDGSNVLVNTTVKKLGIRSKTKNYERSKTLTINLSRLEESGSNENNTINDGLTYNGTAYGRRVQDEELSLNVPDVVKVLSVYESITGSQPTFDTLRFNSTVNVLDNAIIGENIIGESTNAIARVVTNNNSTPSSGNVHKLGIVYLTRQSFNLTETVRFEESNITTTINQINSDNNDGQYKDISKSYTLDKGQREQFYDYSRLVRKNNTNIPSKQLLVVYDHYTVPSNDTGDVFTVLSYPKDRYTNDIPLIGDYKVRATDTLDFRPRVPTFSGTTTSPFTFTSRNSISASEPQYLLKNDSTSILGYEYYLGRIDKLYLTKFGTLSLVKGQSSNLPEPPVAINDAMELATIGLPPYLYTPNDAIIRLTDNRRYTMRDIGFLEDRIENLEEVTTLSLLEVATQSLTIQDANGNNRFKSGFFVDNFKTSNNINSKLSTLSLNSVDGEISPVLSQQGLKLELLGSLATTQETYDSSIDYELIDSNVQKTDNIVTLKYDEVSWISQPYATRVENVNTFHVVVYRGNITLTPARDTGWTELIMVDDTVTNIYEDDVTVIENVIETATDTRNEGRGNRRTTSITTEIDILNSVSVRGDTNLFNQVISDELLNLGTVDARWMRSRNVKFESINLKPITKYYQFLDGISNVPVIPKLLEIANSEDLSSSGSEGTFKIGETVKGYPVISNSEATINRQEGLVDLPLITFRLCSPNHMRGSYNNPSFSYINSPYDESITLPTDYTSSSTILNVDVASLANEDQPDYNGFVWSPEHTVMYLVGEESGAKAWIKDVRLISDAFGNLQGSFYLQDPWSDPPAEVRIPTGRKVYRLTSSPTNQKILQGDGINSFAQTRFESVGLTQNWSRQVENTWITDVTVTNDVRETTVTTHHWEYSDPLAQSFSVAGNVQAPDPNVGLDDDQYGVFLTSVDLYFQSKDTKNNPLTVQVRTMRLGTPTRTVMGSSVTLNPSEIEISDDGETATNVTFPSPIYLPPGEEYAIVLLAPESNEYQVHIARMNEEVTNPSTLPDVNAQKYTVQWAIGSLFKSQNGSIWTPYQNEDLKIKLYKAKFTTNSGTAYFANPQLRIGNQSLNRMKDNPIVTLPKTGQIGISTLYTGHTGIGTFSVGRKVVGSGNNNVTASIVAIGGTTNTTGITTGGAGYKPGTTSTTVSTFNVIGRGSGLSFTNVDASAAAVITDAEIVNPGTGYTTGDVVGLTTADLNGKIGSGALITINTIGGVDTLYVSNVHGTNGTGGFKEGTNIKYYDDSGNLKTPVIEILSGLTEDGAPNDGQHFQVNQFNHGMHSSNNKLKLENVESNLDISKLTTNFNIDTVDQISLASTTSSNLDFFEGVIVSAANTGYLKINNEIIGYKGVGVNLVDTLIRGVDSSQIMNHPAGSIVQKYELNGVSLRRINTEHTISSTDIELDSYYVKIQDDSSNGRLRTKAEEETSTSNPPQLSFDNKGFYGGPNVLGTKNIPFESVIPNYHIVVPGGVTNVSASMRTVSGTSIDGTETSFIDQGYQPVQLNTINKFTTPRLIASHVNETEYLTTISRNKSVTTAIELTTTDENVSPIIYTDTSNVIFNTNRLNNPVSDYTTNNLVNSSSPNVDPNSAIYVSDKIMLNKPADSLKVLFSAYRHSSSDIRVLYSLVRPGDNANVNDQFVLFPGYDNLRDTTGDGFGDQVIDPAKNDGKPDAFVPASLDNQFLEYQFTADHLGDFIGYSVKIIMAGTNQAYAPRIKELRAIAII